MGHLVPPQEKVVVGPKEHLTALHSCAGHGESQRTQSPKGEHLCLQKAFPTAS